MRVSNCTMPNLKVRLVTSRCAWRCCRQQSGAGGMGALAQRALAQRVLAENKADAHGAAAEQSGEGGVGAASTTSTSTTTLARAQRVLPEHEARRALAENEADVKAGAHGAAVDNRAAQMAWGREHNEH